MATTADPVLSVVLLMLTGYAGAHACSALRLPRVIGMILLGAGVAPLLHPSVLHACDAVRRRAGAGWEAHSNPHQYGERWWSQ